VVEQAPKLDKSTVNTKRLAQRSSFWLKEAMAQRGGSEAFLRWLSSEAAKHA
jgi:hypothetical protein